MPKTACVAFTLFCFAALASAQIPTSGNLFAGYSYYNTNFGAQRQSLNGWEGSLEGKPFPVPFLGVVADFSANYGSAKFVNPAATCAKSRSHLCDWRGLFSGRRQCPRR